MANTLTASGWKLFTVDIEVVRAGSERHVLQRGCHHSLVD